MSLTMYRASAPVFLRALRALNALIEKAEASGIPESEFLEARLAPDMHAFPRQIQTASDSAKLCVARLTGVSAPVMEDTEQTLAELKARIASTIAFIESVPESAFAGTETKHVSFKAGPYTLEFTGLDYLFNFAVPNFFFHVTTAYGLLRHKGLQIGKQDFLNLQG